MEKSNFLKISCVWLAIFCLIFAFYKIKSENKSLNNSFEKFRCSLEKFKKIVDEKENKLNMKIAMENFLQNEKVKKDEKYIYYIVQEGDNLFNIALKYKVHIYMIEKWNNINRKSILYPGTILRIKIIKWPTCVGRASWYGPGFHGKRMANGRKYDMNKTLVAHRDYPFGTLLHVTNLKNGKSIIAEVLDRGPYAEDNGIPRILDLSKRAAEKLGAIKPGVILVKIEPIETI